MYKLFLGPPSLFIVTLFYFLLDRLDLLTILESSKVCWEILMKTLGMKGRGNNLKVWVRESMPSSEIKYVRVV